MRYITILDFESGEIHSFPLEYYWGDDFAVIAVEIEDIYGLKFSEVNCQWMIQDKLNFQIH